MAEFGVKVWLLFEEHVDGCGVRFVFRVLEIPTHHESSLKAEEVSVER